jgi:acyl-coenzyme A synthetase/AMP-(fatty) acid ligase
MQEGRSVNLSERLHRVLNQGGEISAVAFGEAIYPWSQIKRFADPFVEFLHQADPDGGVAAIVLRNRPVGVAAMIGLLAERRTSVLISPITTSLNLAADVRALQPSLVIADRQDWNEALEAAVRDAGAAGIELYGADGRLEFAARAGLERAAPGHAPPTGDAGLIVPTSGTTGPPKRIPLTWERLDDYVPREERPIVQRRGVIQSNPLVTIGGIDVLITCAARPLTLLLLERLDVWKWAELVHRHKPPRAGLPPAGMRMMLDAKVPKELLSSLDAWNTGSAPLDPDLADAFSDFYGLPILYTYGATEYGGTVARWTMELRQQWGRGKRGSVGKAAPGVRLRVVDPATGEAPAPGEQGILEVNCPAAPVKPADGWIRSNDLARIDEDGFVFIEGRADDVIIRGGFKVPLNEVEKALNSNPAVDRCAAIGLPDERLGQVPAAVVVLNQGAQATEAELIAWCRERLAAYKVPVRVKIVDAIPLTQTLKVSRPELRALLAD